MNPHRVLITGASGFIGSCLAKRLKQFGFSVMTTSRTGAVDYRIDLSLESPEFTNIDYVVHCAGMAHQLKQSADRMNADTVTATRNLLNGLLKSNLKGFVFLSSVSVYGIHAGENISESTICNPTDAYGKAKLQAEDMVQAWCNDNNVPYLILRLPLVVGPNAPGNLLSLRTALKRRLFFTISDLFALKSMVWHQDISDLIIGKIYQSTFKSGVYNLTDGFDICFNDFVYSYAAFLNLPRPWLMNLYVAKMLARLGDWFPALSFNSKVYEKMSSTLTFDTSKAKVELGWNPKGVLLQLSQNCSKK